MTELCERFGTSRKTGYKIMARYEERGPEGLRDQSRAPSEHPNQTPPDIEAAILRVRPEFECLESHEVRRVRTDGSMRWSGRIVFVGEALGGELVGTEAVDDDVLHLHLGAKRLGAFHDRSGAVVPIIEASE